MAATRALSVILAAAAATAAAAACPNLWTAANVAQMSIPEVDARARASSTLTSIRPCSYACFGTSD